MVLQNELEWFIYLPKDSKSGTLIINQEKPGPSRKYPNSMNNQISYASFKNKTHRYNNVNQNRIIGINLCMILLAPLGITKLEEKMCIYHPNSLR